MITSLGLGRDSQMRCESSRLLTVHEVIYGEEAIG